MKIDHYMVEFENEDGRVVFANDSHITSLTSAKAQAAALSKTVQGGAYVVAFTASSPLEAFTGGYEAVGHISFFDGKQSATDGTVI